MALILNQLANRPGARHKPKCLGRGIGSGKGKTCGRGGKGQTARTGVAIKGFEGGQMPIHRRLPKRGFVNNRRIESAVLNIGTLQQFIDAGKLDTKSAITSKTLETAGAIKSARNGVKILGSGEIKAKVSLEVESASASAIAAIEKAGGKVTIIAALQKKASDKNTETSEKSAAPKKTKKKPAE